jgi:hypothetical protein
MSNVHRFPSIQVSVATCRYCRAPVMASIARFLGSDATGYTCPDCVFTEQEQFRQAQAELTATATERVESDEIAPECAMCHTHSGLERLMVRIDGRMGFICLGCEDPWLRLNRQQLGPRFRQALKL